MDGKFLAKPVAGVPRPTPSTTFRGSRRKKRGIEEARRVIFQAPLSRSSRPENVFRFLSRSSD